MIGAGQSIGNYRILSKIGTGGMGAVYLAEHPLIGKKVALKVIHRELAGNREVVQRFFQEARAVNKIGNEHIVEIHDFGVTPDGDHFYIMEYLVGTTLAAVLAQAKPLEVMRSLHIGAQIAKALAAAHAAGVIHRDLKPDNIMLMTRLGDPDFVKVLDFGLAKIFAGHGSAVNTAAGVLLGTPQYMSPEACECKRDVDHRTDIYALGVLLFQMMTGALPFAGETMSEVLIQQVTALPPAPRGVNPAIPPSVEQVVLRCLAKPPDLRFPTMLALRDALLDPEAYLRGSPPIAPARSVPPGEAKADARTVMMHAAAQLETTVAPIDKLAGTPLPPPTASHPGIAATIVTAGGVPAPAVRRAPAAVPELARPIEPSHDTMRIATPLGHTSRPPRKMLPLVLVLGVALGIGGAAVAWYGRVASEGGATDEAALGSANATAASASSAPVGVAVDTHSATAAPAIAPGAQARPLIGDAAGAPAADAAALPQLALAKLTIESVPPGATVFAPDRKPLGRTPLKIEWPIAAEAVTFELRLAGYRRKPKQIVVGGNTMMRVELERVPRTSPGSGDHEGRGSSNSLMRPE